MALLPGARGKCCVWKVSSGDHTLYLAGSVHALRKSDYPLPAAYEEAFAGSAEIVFETDPRASAAAWEKALDRASRLPGGTTIRDKLDPRTYAFVRQALARSKVPAEAGKKIEHLRPWALGWLLEEPGGLPGATRARGLEAYLRAKARLARKRLSGLVDLKRHIAVFGEMSDADSETFLLLRFLHLGTSGTEYERVVAAWRVGDTGTINRVMREDYRGAPSLYRRIITDRNLAWLPKLEEFLREGGRTRMVVVGAAHTAGTEGLPALLRAQGYAVEQM